MHSQFLATTIWSMKFYFIISSVVLTYIIWKIGVYREGNTAPGKSEYITTVLATLIP